MTVHPWPPGETPRRGAIPRKRVVDKLPQSVLYALVCDLPAPKGETEAERAIRFEAQLAEVLSYKPRDSADAMIATHCVLLRLVAEDSRRDAVRPGVSPAIAKKFLLNAKQLDNLAAEIRQTFARRQARTGAEPDPALFESLGLSQFLIPDPDDPAQPEEAVSAVIVPLHPAPKMLQ